MAVTFDTLKFVETLERASLTREQASAIASAVRDAQNVSEVATKQDLRDMEADVDSKFGLLRKDMDLMRKDMDLMHKDLIIKLGSMVIGTGVILIAAMGAFAAFLKN